MKEIITWAVDFINIANITINTIYYRPVADTVIWSEQVPTIQHYQVPEECPPYKSFICEDEEMIGEPYLVKIKYIPESFEFERI